VENRPQLSNLVVGSVRSGPPQRRSTYYLHSFIVLVAGSVADG
jgi:hypothetical protein